VNKGKGEPVQLGGGSSNGRRQAIISATLRGDHCIVMTPYDEDGNAEGASDTNGSKRAFYEGEDRDR